MAFPATRTVTEPFALAEQAAERAAPAHGCRTTRRRRGARVGLEAGRRHGRADGHRGGAGRPPRVPRTDRRRPRSDVALGRARRRAGAAVPGPPAPVRGARPERRRPRRAHGGRRRLPHHRHHQRRRLAARGLADRPARPDRRPPEPDGPLAAHRARPAAAARTPLRRSDRPVQRVVARDWRTRSIRRCRRASTSGCTGRTSRRRPRCAWRRRSAPTSSACRP